MKLQFDLIDIRDFKELRGQHKLALHKLGLGVHFIKGVNQVEPRLGSNGASKSSIFDAICWCLYGRTIRGLRGTDIQTWGTKTKPRVEISIKVDGKPHKIARSTVTNGLWIDDKVVEQAEIDKLIGLTFSNFPHTILLGQAAPLFFDLKAPEKMELLSETLDLDRWEERSKRAREAVGELDDSSRSLMATCAQLKKQLEQSELDFSGLKQRSEDWIAERAGRDKERAKMLKQFGAELKANEKIKGDHDLALDAAELELRACEKLKLTKSAQLLKENSEVAKLGAELRVLGVVLEELDAEQSISGENCPTCGQSLRGTALAKHNAQIKRKIVEKETEEKKLEKIHQAAIKQRDKTDIEITALNKQIANYSEKSDDARDGLSRASAIVSDLKAKIKAAEAQSSVDENEVNPYAELLRKTRKQRTATRESIEDNEAQQAAIARQREHTLYWVQGFRNVRLHLLQEVLEELQSVTQTLLPQSGLDDWEVQFAMERETQSGKIKPGLNVSIFKPKHDEPVKWESWSGGESQRLRVIGAVALSEVLLRRAGVTCDLIVLDEPTRHLSPEGVGDLVEFLVELGRDHQVFYIDHQVVQSNQFASLITVTRSTSGAKISIER